MEYLKTMKPLFTAIIAIMAILSFLLLGVSSMLSAQVTPLKENQVRLEAEIKAVKVELNNRMDRMESKLDQLLSSRRPASSQ